MHSEVVASGVGGAVCRMQVVREKVAGVCPERCHPPSCKCCGSTLTKIVLVVVNFGFLACGWAMVGLGVYIHLYHETFYYTHFLKENPSAVGPVIVFENIPFILMGIGGIIAAMSFLGCCGACAESVCFLGFYSLLLVAFVVAEVVAGSLSTRVRDDISKKLLTSMHYQLRYQYNNTAQRNSSTTDIYKLTLAWDSLQVQLNCCGAYGPYDFLYSSWFNHTNTFDGVFVPSTCCFLNNTDAMRPEVRDAILCQVEAIVYRNTNQPIMQLHTQGCYAAILNWVQSNVKMAISLIALTVLLQILNLFFACFLIGWVRKKHSDYSWCENDEYE